MNFAPLNVPLERRLQTLSVLLWIISPILSTIVLVFVALNPLSWPFLIIYCCHIWFMDTSPYDGRRRSNWLKKAAFPSRYFTEYFPARLIKEIELHGDEPYLFCYHPHGILGLGVWANFISDGSGFSRLFPWIDLRFATLELNFRVPLWRDFLLALGFVGVSKHACDNILKQSWKLSTLNKKCSKCKQKVTHVGKDTLSTTFNDETREFHRDAVALFSPPGQGTSKTASPKKSISNTNSGMQEKRECLCQSPLSLLIVVGGASEALDAHPRTFNIILNRRKGIFRLSYQHGVPLVPVLSFGENDLYSQVDNPPGSTLRRIQVALLKYFGFSMPLFWGRGIFQYNFGILPQRNPITTVVGRPVRPPCVERDPSEEQINALRTAYVQELTRIWDKYKDQYARNRRQSLTIVN